MRIYYDMYVCMYDNNVRGRSICMYEYICTDVCTDICTGIFVYDIYIPVERFFIASVKTWDSVDVSGFIRLVPIYR